MTDSKSGAQVSPLESYKDTATKYAIGSGVGGFALAGISMMASSQAQSAYMEHLESDSDSDYSSLSSYTSQADSNYQTATSAAGALMSLSYILFAACAIAIACVAAANLLIAYKKTR